jgi:DNA polymerase III subunit gamma/tau
MSWYRTYRPQTVASLHIAPVREFYERILSSGEFTHAYLLCGPKGTGKTSGARILAKILNCEKNRENVEIFLSGQKTKGQKPFVEPCNECATCQAITAGQSLCVTEMDAASNRGIDDIRQLTERIGLSSGDGVVSVYIIDEVHMLTTEAFNALLKVLEEPPAHVVFLLATTERQKVPETIVSRCQVVTYRKASPQEIGTALQSIAKIEKIEVAANLIERIAAVADGSLRDAVKLFEQVGKGKAKVSLEDTNDIIGESFLELTEKLILGLAKKDFPKVVSVFEEIDSRSYNALQFQKEVLAAIHKRLIEAPEKKSPYLPVYIQLLKQLNVPASTVLPLPHLPFELACLEWCVPEVKVVEKTSGPITIRPLHPSSSAQKKTFVNDESLIGLSNPLSKRELVTEETVIAEEKIEAAKEEILEIPISLTFEEIVPKWHVVLRELKDKNTSLEALFRSTKPFGLQANTLQLEVLYKFHKDQLELDRNLRMIEEALLKIFGCKMRLEFSLAKKAAVAATTPDSNISGAVADVSLVRAAEEAFL